MRKPNHIILDFESNQSFNSSFYWANNLLTKKKNPLFFDYISISRKYNNVELVNKTQSFLSTNSSNTVRPNNLHKATLLKDWEKKGFSDMYRTSTLSPHSNHDTLSFLTLLPQEYTKYKLGVILDKCYNVQGSAQYYQNYVTYTNLVNINFLRKERLYTKLKYSRSPAYDIVSGGAAALLAGFIGFLISEKFGYELVDSGDFYYAFMYLVFLTFSIRPLLTVSDANKGFIQMFSLRNISVFYINLIKVLFKKFK